MKRILQLVNEAIEEIERYGSCEGAYQLLKYISSTGEKFIKEEEVKYDFTLDQLILLSMSKKTKKYKLLASSFFVYDYLSKKYKIQDPLFTFRWGKLYFIYSYRIVGRLSLLVEKGFLQIERRGEIKLTSLGEEESKNLFSMLNQKEKDEIKKVKEKVEQLTLTELRTYTKKYLFEVAK